LNKTPTVSVILANTCSEILLQLRDDKPGLLWAGHWTLPGGYVESDETPDQAIAREMIEEMELHDLDLRLWKRFEATRGDPPILCAEHIFVGRLDREAETISLHEGQRIAFFGCEPISGMVLAFNYTPVALMYFNEEQEA
jgi:8-oxo-dGTP diphosphatase